MHLKYFNVSKSQDNGGYDYNYAEFIKVLSTVQNTRMPSISGAES